jgi:hypothetical protein
MMRKRFYTVFVVLLCAGVAPVLANQTYGDGGAALKGVLDGITTSPNAGLSSVNVVTDPIPDGADSLWHITGTGGSVATLIIQLASGAPGNQFGVYDAGNPALRVPLFTGPQSAGAMTVLAIQGDGSVWVGLADTGIDINPSGWFGYYLDTRQVTGGGNLWYSDTALNGGEDHMVAIRGTNTDTVQLLPWGAGLWTNNEYVLAFEDLPLASSSEYDDFAVMVESIYVRTPPVPAPGALLLGLLGVAGVTGLKLRKRV